LQSKNKTKPWKILFQGFVLLSDRYENQFFYKNSLSKKIIPTIDSDQHFTLKIPINVSNNH